MMGGASGALRLHHHAPAPAAATAVVAPIISFLRRN
jgi:hypothetical protein